MPAGFTQFDHMVSSGNLVPWHGLEHCTVLPAEKLDSREALVYAKMDNWELHKQPVYFGNPEDGYHQIPNKWAIVRGKDNTGLSVVGNGYKIFSNEDSFAWFDNLLGEGFHYVTAGSLGGGTTVWILAKAPFELDLPDSKINFFTLLKGSHDGTSSIQALNTPVRVVCENTLGSALGGATRIIRVNHTLNAAERLNQAMTYLGYAQHAKKELELKVGILTSTKLTDADWINFMDKLAPIPAEEGRAQTMAKKVQEQISKLYFSAQETEIRGTAWGAYNAVVAYHDHVMGSRSKINSPAENRFSRIMFGGKNITDRALELLS